MTRHNSNCQKDRHGLRSPRKQIGACVPLLMRRARWAKKRAPRLPCVPEVVFLTVLTGLLAKAALLAIFALNRRPSPTQTVSEGSAQSPQSGASSAYSGLDETAGIIHGQTPRGYLPPLSTRDLELARALDFLIRNGGSQGPVAARRWQVVERVSLPLAVYLREIDDRSRWGDLRNEIRRTQVSCVRVPDPSERDLNREYLVRVATLADAWVDRGRDLLAELEKAEKDSDSPKLTLHPSEDQEISRRRALKPSDLNSDEYPQLRAQQTSA